MFWYPTVKKIHKTFTFQKVSLSHGSLVFYNLRGGSELIGIDLICERVVVSISWRQLLRKGRQAWTIQITGFHTNFSTKNKVEPSKNVLSSTGKNNSTRKIAVAFYRNVNLYIQDINIPKFNLFKGEMTFICKTTENVGYSNQSLRFEIQANGNLIQFISNSNCENDKIFIDPSSTFTLNKISMMTGGFFDFNTLQFNISVLLHRLTFAEVLESIPKLKKIFSESTFIGQIGIRATITGCANWLQSPVITFMQNSNVKCIPSQEFINVITGDLPHTIAPMSNINHGDGEVKPVYCRAIRNVILATEDPNFFSHNGLDLKAIGYAIGENCKNRRIIRGASTISMQLVKNLFLTEERSIFRKIEELIITLVIENLTPISKITILNRYLSIIKFADAVYGVPSATKFYFNKSVHELDLDECLVLSYIVPRPDYFLDALTNKSDKLIINLASHFRFYVPFLIKKGWITKIEASELNYKVPFFGNKITIDLKLLKYV